MILQMWVEFKDPFLHSTAGLLSRLTFPATVLPGKGAAVAASALQVMAVAQELRGSFSGPVFPSLKCFCSSSVLPCDLSVL